MTDLFNELQDLRLKGPKHAVNVRIEEPESPHIPSVSSLPSSTPESDVRANEPLKPHEFSSIMEVKDPVRRQTLLLEKNPYVQRYLLESAQM